MDSDSNQETFGGYLADFRNKRELTIETIAAKTRIAAHCLRAIEANAHDQLPPPAYVKSFIRTYARTLGANADVAVNLYQADIERQANVTQKLLRRRANLWAVRRVLMAVGLIAVILLILRFSDMGPDPIPSPPKAVTDESDRPAPSASMAQMVEERRSVADIEGTLKLKVVAVETTWLKIIVDGQRARSYNLKPEERLELEGSNNFNLMIGNASGLKIFLNDRPVKIFGSSGQVVSLKIP
jgi:cytoskeletal protein RodZ